MLKSGEVLSNRWKIGTKVGEGGCASVYEVTSTSTLPPDHQYDYVIKCAALPPPAKSKSKGKTAISMQERLANTLYYEHMLYKGALLTFPYAVHLPPYAYGEDKGYRYLVLQRLHYDLRHFCASNSPSPASVARIGQHILEGLRTIHRLGYVYIDVKPDNFMMLKHSKKSKESEFVEEDRLFFVDFGLMEKFTSYNTGGIRERMQKGGAVVGTPAFSSLSVNEGYVAARKDDLESLGYVLLSLFNKSTLPWSNSNNDADCLRQKRSCNVDSYADSLGVHSLGQFISLARGLEYAEEPDYDRFKALLEKCSREQGPSSSSSSSKSRSRKSLEEAQESAPEPRKRTKKAVQEEKVEVNEAKENDKVEPTAVKQTKKKPATGRVNSSKRSAVEVLDSDDDEGKESVTTPKKRGAKASTKTTTKKIQEESQVSDSEGEWRESLEADPKRSKRTARGRDAVSSTKVSTASADEDRRDSVEIIEPPVESTAKRTLRGKTTGASLTSSQAANKENVENSKVEIAKTTRKKPASKATVAADSPLKSSTISKNILSTPVSSGKRKLNNIHATVDLTAGDDDQEASDEESVHSVTPKSTRKPAVKRNETPEDKLTSTVAQWSIQQESPRRVSFSTTNSPSSKWIVARITKCSDSELIGREYRFQANKSSPMDRRGTIKSKGKGKRDVINDSPTVDVGRARRLSGIVIESDDILSEEHALLKTTLSDNGTPQFCVKDLHSTNGTWINKSKLSPDKWCPAQIGDSIRFGSTEFIISADA